MLFFKYFNSVINLISNLTGDSINSLQILIPLGISFFTLQQISYIIDCYNENIKKYNIIDYTLFVCFFPQLVAGPIVRHQEMIPQFNNIKNQKINQNNIFIGLFLITCGLLKKVILADEFSDFISFITENKIYTDFYISWLLCITKILNIYFDFSGYCDIALGSAALFNIKLPWNFNAPFQAQNIYSFWQKNNMTLVRFLKNYIYIPLKKKNLNKYINILTMYFVLGLWMGINFISILYGILNGIYICINIFWRKRNIQIPSLIAKSITFIAVLISAPFLFENNISSLCTILKSMFCIETTFSNFIIQDNYLRFLLPPPHNAQINIILLFVSFIIIFLMPDSNVLAKIYSKKNNTIYTIALALIFIFVVVSMTKTNSFIYFNF